MSPSRGNALSADARLRRWTNRALMIAILVGVLVAGIHGGNRTTSIAAFGAALAIGSVLGFLFGIPGPSAHRILINQPGTVALNVADIRHSEGGGQATGTVAEPTADAAAGQPSDEAPGQAGANAADKAGGQPAEKTTGQNGSSKNSSSQDSTSRDSSPQSSARQEPLSNMEQVSDWVTKLLLGGTLTQLQRIPPKVWQWSRTVAVGITGNATATMTDPVAKEQLLEAQQSFAAGLLVYGFVLGFFAGFLITKLQLGRAVTD